MESDLPLMEIAEEDDSLIQQFPDRNQTPSKSSLNYFTCSPFALPPSHTKRLKDDVNTEKASSSSSEASNNKENINSNNVEVPKLGMEPMQMKRRKKGGGCNLRKSLAWDRAFFTDEGILDPLEFTLITGINGNTCGGGLPTIREEGNSSFSSNTKCINEPNNIESSEEVLLKKLDEQRSTSKGNREKASCSEGNHDSLPHHKVTHKILPIDHTNRTGSKVGGCSVPLAASFLKRPANSTTLKAANKESKLPKLPKSKPGSCFSAMTKGSVSASQLRHTLIAKPTTNPKNDVLKSSIKHVHGSQSKSKLGAGILRLPVKERAQKAVRNMTNSSSKATSSTKSREILVNKANSWSEMVPDRLQLCEIQEGSAALASKHLVKRPATNLNNPVPATTSPGPCQIHRAGNGFTMSDNLHPCESQVVCAALAASHRINLSYTDVYLPNIQYAKPSGLRLPSPSLRFFDQRVGLESGPLQQEKVQYNTNMGSNRKNGELMPPITPASVTINVCSVPSTLSIHNYLELEKNARKVDVQMKLSHAIEQSGEDNGANIHFAGNVGCNNNIGVGTRQLMSQGHNERVALPETEGNFVFHNEEDSMQNFTAISTSASGKSIQHQEKNILTALDGSTNFMQVLAQTSREQADTEKADAPNVNPKSNLDATSFGAEVSASEVFVESRKDAIGKRKDDIGTTKWDSPCLESNSVALQSENIGQENDVDKVVNSVYRSSPVEDDARCYNDDPLSKNERTSISFQDGGNIDALKGTITKMYPPHISPQDMNTEQGNGDAEVQLEIQEHPLIDSYNHSNLSNPRPEVELISGISSLDDDAFLKTESVLEVARCPRTYPHCLDKEGVDIAVATTEIEFKIHEENQKSQEMDMFIGSLSEKSIVDANPTIQGCTGGLETYDRFQSENQTLEVSGTVSNFPEMHTEDAQMQLSDDGTLVRSCSTLTAVLHNPSMGDVYHTDIFEKQSEFIDTDIKLEQDPESIHPSISNTDNVLQESVYKVLSNDVDRSDVDECDPKPSNIIVHCSYVGKEVRLVCNNNGQPYVECGTLGPAVMDPKAQHTENYNTDRQSYNTECCNLSHHSELEASGEDEMVGVDTACMGHCSAGAESCSFSREVAGFILEEMPTRFGALTDNGQGLANSDQVFIKHSLSPEKILDLETPTDAMDNVIVVLEQNVGHGCDLQDSNGGAQILPMAQGNASGLNGQSGYGIESNGLDPLSNSKFPVSQHPTISGKDQSTMFCSVSGELHSASGRDKTLQTSTSSIGDEGSKMSLGEELETEALLEGKNPMMAEFHHELDGESDLKHKKDATTFINRSDNLKRRDNSLVVHLPNAVPFSDEWLAAIEAAGEEILTMKSGAVQHSPQDKSNPEPSPWSPVKKKANQIGPYDCTKYTNVLPPNPH